MALIRVFLITLLTGALSQPIVDVVQIPQVSSINPATSPNDCDDSALSSHIESAVNNLPPSLSVDGGALDNVNYVLRGRNMSNPANSCSEIYNLNPNTPSGNYWLTNQADGTPVSVYCDMEIMCGCSSQRGWSRVAVFDMSNPTTQCPSQWRLLISDGKRACGKGSNGWGWNARAYSLEGVPYQRVCGKVIGYVYGSPDVFIRWQAQQWRTVNDVYFDGVDIVYGSYDINTDQTTFNHVWTYAANFYDYNDRCPCSTASNRPVPTFLGSNYYCEGGGALANGYSATLKTADPLWDGMGCLGAEGPCCNGAPQFCRNLTSPTTDDLIVRLMTDEPLSNEDVTVHYYELYVQ